MESFRNVQFLIRAGDILPAGGTLVLVGFDLHRPDAAASFRSNYGLDDTAPLRDWPLPWGLAKIPGEIMPGAGFADCRFREQFVPYILE